MNKYLEKIASNDVEFRVKKVLGNTLKVNPSSIKSHHSLMRDLHMDNYDAVEAVMNLEEEFGKAIPDDVAGKLTHVHHLTKYFGGLQKVASDNTSVSDLSYKHLANISSALKAAGKIPNGKINSVRELDHAFSALEHGLANNREAHLKELASVHPGKNAVSEYDNQMKLHLHHAYRHVYKHELGMV